MIATGPFQVPVVPDVSSGLDPGVIQLHSNDHHNADALPAGRVLVVGAGKSGCQISGELTATHAVELATGEQHPVLPQRPLGRDICWWFSGLRVDRVTRGSRPGKRIAGRDPVFGNGPRQLGRRYGVAIRNRVIGATGATVRFQEGSSTLVDAVVWATGTASIATARPTETTVLDQFHTSKQCSTPSRLGIASDQWRRVSRPCGEPKAGGYERHDGAAGRDSQARR